MALPLRAQMPLRPTLPAPPEPLATLTLWADDVWLALTDRDGSYHGRLADQGTFQRFNPLMDDEYELDLWTGLFSPAEDARWAGVARGLRIAGASINHPFILNVVDWREIVPIAGPVEFLARYRRQRSLTAQRDYPRIGIRWRDAFRTPWTATVSLGVHFFKPSADVEIALARRWGRPTGAQWSGELRLALLDAFNNVIFNALGVGSDETDAHFDYRALPLAARLALVHRSTRWRGELVAGATSRSRVLVTFPASGDPSYALTEAVRFLGLLAEASLSPRAALAVYGTTARASTLRQMTSPAPGDLRLLEETSAVGGRARSALGRTLGLELDVRHVWRPESRRDSTSVRHRDREAFGQVALVARPPQGWTWRLAYAVLDRRAGVLAPRLTATNHRQLMEAGHRFRSGFEMTGGVRWDVDRMGSNPFDGGHLRFTAAW